MDHYNAQRITFNARWIITTPSGSRLTLDGSSQRSMDRPNAERVAPMIAYIYVL